MPPKFYKKYPTKTPHKDKIDYDSYKSSTYLLIVESPSKCKKIEEYLGPQYKCISSKGHLREIKGLKSINIKGNYEIEFSIIKEKESHIEFMRKIISFFPPKNILLATDDDREGEAISWHICDLFQLPVETTPRIVFHEITQSAILESIQNPRTVNMGLVNSQKARQILDMIVGFKVSPYLWKYIYSSKTNSLSAGRCQTPCLRLVYDNEKEREQQGGAEMEYKTTAYFSSSLSSSLGSLPFKLNGEIKHTNKIKEFLELSKTHPYSLSKDSPMLHSEGPPKPFNTSRLLQTASNLLHISPKQTMAYCQRLYQEGYITYMRTDSQKYSTEFLNKATHYIQNKWTAKYVGYLDNLENKDKKNPHEAIRITKIDLDSIYIENEKQLCSLYKLIWKNTIESCMSKSTYHVTNIHMSAPLNYRYVHSIQLPSFYGWKIVNLKTDTHLTEEQNKITTLLMCMDSIINQGSPITYIKIESIVNMYNKHSHYTEASLIEKLEDLGIGRPSTFSMLVETIKDRGYVKRMDLVGEPVNCTEYILKENIISETKKEKIFGNEKNKIVIQPIGILTVEFLIQNFEKIFSYDYTKWMEEQLDIICHNEVDETHENTYNICKICCDELKELSKNIKNMEKQSYKIDKDYCVVFQKFGAVLKKTLEDGKIEYKSIKKDLNLDLDKLKRGEYSLDDLIEIKNDILGVYKDEKVTIKSGMYGPYIEWGDKRESIKHIIKPLNEITLEDVLPIIDPEVFVTSTNPDAIRKPPVVGKSVLRIVDDNISIRKGKFGPYIFYKTIDMNSPEFFSMTGFKGGFNSCKIEDLKDWIKEKHKIPR